MSFSLNLVRPPFQSVIPTSGQHLTRPPAPPPAIRSRSFLLQPTPPNDIVRKTTKTIAHTQNHNPDPDLETHQPWVAWEELQPPSSAMASGLGFHRHGGPVAHQLGILFSYFFNQHVILPIIVGDFFVFYGARLWLHWHPISHLNLHIFWSKSCTLSQIIVVKM